MRFRLAKLALATCCLAAIAAPAAAVSLPPEGNAVTVEGRAHIEKNVQGTYIHLNEAGDAPLIAFVPFGDEGALGDLRQLEGRDVALTGVVTLGDGHQIIVGEPDSISVG